MIRYSRRAGTNVIMHQLVGYTKPQLSVPAPSFEAVQALAASRVVPGDSHPDTIEVMMGLASNLEDRGDPGSALVIAEDALAR
jgi:hypothetical protein